MEKKKKVNRVALGLFGIGLMLFNYWLYKSGMPFNHFVFMSFITNILLGLGFARVYITLTQKREDK